jgi:hypothetical protein
MSCRRLFQAPRCPCSDCCGSHQLATCNSSEWMGPGFTSKQPQLSHEHRMHTTQWSFSCCFIFIFIFSRLKWRAVGTWWCRTRVGNRGNCGSRGTRGPRKSRTCAARCGHGQQRQAAHDAASQKPCDVHHCSLNSSASGHLKMRCVKQ